MIITEKKLRKIIRHTLREAAEWEEQKDPGSVLYKMIQAAKRGGDDQISEYVDGLIEQDVSYEFAKKMTDEMGKIMKFLSEYTDERWSDEDHKLYSGKDKEGKTPENRKFTSNIPVDEGSDGMDSLFWLIGKRNSIPGIGKQMNSEMWKEYMVHEMFEAGALVMDQLFDLEYNQDPDEKEIDDSARLSSYGLDADGDGVARKADSGLGNW
jgi:hypothetical protein